MKSLFALSLLFLGLVACHQDTNVVPQYEDWYAIKAPEAQDIEAVYGDLNETLLITTGFKIYQTKDQGKTWLTADYKGSNHLTGFSASKDTVFALSGLENVTYTPDSSASFAASPAHFSLDKGASWQYYVNRSPNSGQKVDRNRVTNAAGVVYSVERRLTPTTPDNTSSYYIETIGIKTSTGNHFTLPHAHRINSIYLDKKARLYVAGSGPLCGSPKNVAYCGDRNGMLYIAK